MVIVSSTSKQVIGTLKMSGGVRDISFGPYPSAGLDTSAKKSEHILYSVGEDREVYIWDLRKRQCICRHFDEGMAQIATVASSPQGRFYATGYVLIELVLVFTTRMFYCLCLFCFLLYPQFPTPTPTRQRSWFSYQSSCLF